MNTRIWILTTAALMLMLPSSLNAGVFDDAEAYWSFDVDFSDATGNHDGTAEGSPTITSLPGESMVGGGALALNGTDQAISFGDIPLSGDFSLAAWVLPRNINTATTSSAILFGDGPGLIDNNLDWIRLESTTFRMKWNGATTTSSTSPSFENNYWQHFALTRENGQVTVYRNGAEVASVAKTDTFTPSYIGNKQLNWYEGLVDETAIWTRSLSGSEIADLYGQGQIPEGPALSTVVAASLSVDGDSTSTSASVAQSTGSRVTLNSVAQGSYEPAVDGSMLDPADGVLMVAPRANEVWYPAVSGMRYPTAEVSRAGGTLSISTMMEASMWPERMATDTAMAWFSFEDDWIGAHVNADGTVHAGGGVDNSMITYTEVVSGDYGPAPAYDIVIPGTGQNTGMLFAVGSSTTSDNAEQVHVASTMAIDGGWRVSLLDSKQGSYPDETSASEFSFVYVPFTSEGLVAGHIKAEDGAVIDGRTVGDYTMVRTGYGTFELTVDGYTPDEGVLLLGALDWHPTTNMPQDDWVTYAPSEDGQKFVIWTRDLDGEDYLKGLTPTDFVFAFIPMGDTGPLPGDLNDDGFVGGDDLDIVRSFWGQHVTSGDLESGDPSGDGFVGGDDLDIVRANWGQGTQPAPSAVPEPSTFAGLIALALAAALAARRRRFQRFLGGDTRV